MRFYGLIPVAFVRALRAMSGATMATLLVCGPAALALVPPEPRSPHDDRKPAARAAMETAVWNEGLEWYFELDTREGLEFDARDGNDLDWILCTAHGLWPVDAREAIDGARPLRFTSRSVTWKAVFNSATGRLYRIFGFRQGDVQDLLRDAVGKVDYELQAMLIAKFYALHVYAEETEILWSEWDAYAFAFSHIGRDGSERRDRQAAQQATSPFWRKVHGPYSNAGIRDAAKKAWVVQETIGSYLDRPGENKVEFRRLTIAVTDTAAIEVRKDELLGTAESNYERHRVDLRLAPAH